MTPDDLKLVVSLVDPEVRPAAVAALAARARARRVHAFVPDPELSGKLVPAYGFPRVVTGGRPWRDVLGPGRVPGVRTLTLPDPEGSAEVRVHDLGDVVWFFVGCIPDPTVTAALTATLAAAAPLLARIFVSELRAQIQDARVHAAREATAQAAALTAALDRSRGALQRALVEAAAQSEAIDLARREAVAAIRTKDEFLAMLGHELRNPLAPIRTALQLLRLRGERSSELDVIDRQVTHLARLVDDLLDVSRITTGRVALRTQRVELGAVAAQAIEMASPLLESRHQSLTVDVPGSGLAVDGDPARLAQVVSNLLTNASKYSAPRTRITLCAQAMDDRVRVSVEDQGIGLEPDMIERVFHHFVQGPQDIDRAGGGLGLGLAIVRSFVELHGGRAWAESAGRGCGSRFVVELPAAPTARARSTAQSLPPQSDADHTGTRVLVVDDNEDALLLLSEILSLLGYRVDGAADGPLALQAAEAGAPQVAILDLGLPVMDGFELARHLRAMHPAVKLIALSGYGTPADRERTTGAGFHAHLVKPVDLDELEACIAALLA